MVLLREWSFGYTKSVLANYYREFFLCRVNNDVSGFTGIKLIAVDMDGTFLRDNKTYDRGRFQAQFMALQARGIRFVVASGNQYYRLREYFAGIDCHDIAYVAENGGYVHDGEQELYVADIPADIMGRVYSFLNTIKDVSSIICGKNSAYTLTSIDQAEYDNALNHYQRLQRVEHYQDINDTIIKIALKVPAQIFDTVLSDARQMLGDVLVPVSSGHQWLDLIVPGVHKAHGLGVLQQQWGISDQEVAAFGDSGNDLEMLQKAGCSFAMANGSEAIRQVARYAAAGNNQDGVLEMIDRILESVSPQEA